MKEQKLTTVFLATILFALLYASNVQCAIMQMDTSTNKNDGNKILLTLDTSEADEVLVILALRAEGMPISDSEWQKLFEHGALQTPQRTRGQHRPAFP